MEPLPSGWVDTGITATLVNSCGGQFGSSVQADITGVGERTEIRLGLWLLWVDSTDGVTSPSKIKAVAGDDLVDVETGLPEYDTYDVDSATFGSAFSVTQTYGPVRLGVVYELIGATQYPNHAKDYQLRYAWFADENTVYQSVLNGTHTHTEPQEVGVGDPPVELSGVIGSMTIGAQCYGIGPTYPKTYAYFTDWNVGDVVDTSDLDYTGGSNLHLLGSGGGDATAMSTVAITNPTTVEAYAAPPYIIHYDIDVQKTDGTTQSAEIVTSNLGTVTGPYSALHVFRNVSWAAAEFSGSEQLTVDSTWAAAEDPAWDTSDLFVELHGSPALDDPSELNTYSPIVLQLDDVIPILRPDGVNPPPSSFVASSGDITVNESATEDEFVVGATGSYVRREFGATGTDLPEWRRWLGVGASGKADALFNPDLTGKTKHTTNADIFDWNSYAYLKVEIESPANGTLIMTVEGVSLEVTDTHVTGSQRNTDFAVLEEFFEHEYDVPVVIGANVVYLRLLFPNTAVASLRQPGRVDAIKLEGFAVGTYTLTGLTLVSMLTPTSQGADEVYIKCGFRGYGNADYDALIASHNGAACMAGLADRDRTTEWVGNDGHGLRYVTQLSGYPSGIVQDAQKSLEAFITQLNNIEGWTCTYSAAAYEGANEDTFGTQLAPELAQWVTPVYPHTVNAGSAAYPTAAPRCGKINVVNGQEFLIFTRDVKGSGMLEGLMTDDDGDPVAAGTGVDVIRTDTNAVQTTLTTDAHAYVIGGAIPSNGTLIWKFEGGILTVALRPRDLRRLEGALAGDNFHLDLLQLAGVPFWFRSYRSATSAGVQRSRDAGASWESTATIAGSLDTGTDVSIPTLAASRWDDVFCLFHDDLGGVRIYRSHDLGATFTLHGSHSSYKYPRMVVGLERTWLAMHNGTRLEFHYSADFGDNLTEVTALRITCPLQLCAFRQDRRGYLHVLYVDGSDALQHVYSLEGAAWSAPNEVATDAQFPAWASTLASAMYSWWDPTDTSMHVARLEEDYRTEDGELTPPAGTWIKGTWGLHQSVREEYYLVGKISDVETRYSPDQMATWAEPV